MDKIWLAFLAETILLIVGVWFAIWKAGKIAKVTAEETAKVELNKIKSQKWWDKKVAMYEKIIVKASETISLLALAKAICINSNTEDEFLKGVDKQIEASLLLGETTRLMKLGRFYFNEKSRKIIDSGIDALTEEIRNMSVKYGCSKTNKAFEARILMEISIKNDWTKNIRNQLEKSALIDLEINS